MKILVTGSSGLIGSAVIHSLTKQGHECVSIDIRSPPWDGQGFFPVNLLDDMKRSKLIRGIDGVIHLAAVSRVITAEFNPEKCIKVNVDGTRALLKDCLGQDKPPWFIYGSSREVYGDPTSYPVSENHKVNPKNIYGISKAKAENLVEDYSIKTRRPSFILRFSNVYGSIHDYPTRVIPAFVLGAALGQSLRLDGSSHSFDFTHISDVERILLTAVRYLEDQSVGHVETLNVLPGEETALIDLVHHLSVITGREIEYYESSPRDYDVSRFVGCPDRMYQILGERCEVAIEEGLNQYYSEYQRHIRNTGVMSQ